MDKNRINNLLSNANKVLNCQIENEKLGISRILNNGEIDSAYNGSIASLGVSVAMSGLLATLAIYYQEKNSSNSKPKANRRSVLDAIARIITDDKDKKEKEWDFSKNQEFAKNLFRYAIDNNNQKKLKDLKQEVIDCSIALKQIVRTYNLV